MKLTSTTLDQLRILTLRLFIIGAVCVFIPVVVVLEASGLPLALRIILIVIAVVGVAIIGVGLGAFSAANGWNKKRRLGWTRLDVHVVPDDATGEVDKTLLDSNDRLWRIAMARYPLALRDVLIADHTIEYVGELRHDKPILMRPAAAGGRYYESFGHVKARAKIPEP